MIKSQETVAQQARVVHSCARLLVASRRTSAHLRLYAKERQLVGDLVEAATPAHHDIELYPTTSDSLMPYTIPYAGRFLYALCDIRLVIGPV